MNNDKNEITEMWHEVRQDKQNKHAANKGVNLATLARSGLSYRKINMDECVLFREPGKPQCDFYPSSGKWKWVIQGEAPRYFDGGATSFINWYRKH